MTPGAAAARAIEQLQASIPGRDWRAEGAANGIASLVADGLYGPIRLDVDGAARVVRLTFCAVEAGVLRVVRLAIGPVEAGRSWPERLAEGAAAFMRGDPDPTIRHRRAPPPPVLDEVRVRWTCPACQGGEWTGLGTVLHRAGVVNCAVCRRPATLELMAAAEPVRLRLVEAPPA